MDPIKHKENDPDMLTGRTKDHSGWQDLNGMHRQSHVKIPNKLHDELNPRSPAGLELTVLRVHREVRLSLQDAIHQLCTVTVRLIVCVCGSDGDNWRTCKQNMQCQAQQCSVIVNTFGSGSGQLHYWPTAPSPSHHSEIPNDRSFFTNRRGLDVFKSGLLLFDSDADAACIKIPLSCMNLLKWSGPLQWVLWTMWRGLLCAFQKCFLFKPRPRISPSFIFCHWVAPTLSPA